MKFFRNEVLRSAVEAKAGALALPGWLSQAREVLARFDAADGGDAAELAERMLAIEGWLEGEGGQEARAEELDALLGPVKQLLSDALCKVEQGPEGRVARLWHGQSALALKEGGFELEGLGQEPLRARSASGLFKASHWDGSPGLEENGAFGLDLSSRLSEMFSRIYDIHEGGAEPVEELLRRPRERAPEKEAFAGVSDEKMSLAVARGVLGLDFGEREKEDESRLTRLRSALRLSLKSVPGHSPAFHLNESARELMEEQALAGPAVDEAAPERSESAAASQNQRWLRGLERAEALREALQSAGQRALEGARAMAGARLLSFMEQEAPGSDEAQRVAERVWGLPVSISASVSAGSWAPVAKRLLAEDPRRGALALAIAPDLGLRPSLSLLSEVKEALKSAGLPESVWREMGRLPKEDFQTLLTEFKRVATRSTLYGRSDGHVAFGPVKSVMEDPFAALAPGGASKELAAAVERCAVVKEVADLAKMPFSCAVGLCLSQDASESPAWRGAADSKGGDDLGRAMWFTERRTAEKRLLALSLGEGFDRVAEAVGQEEAAKERAAARVKAPRVLALAMREAAADFTRAREQLKDMFDWISRSEHGFWQQLPEKMTWASLRRREQAWHRELQAAKDAEFQTPWAQALEEPVALGGLSARELRNGAELFEEGKAMHHCVSSYAADCREGKCRIYSIVNGQGERLATLEAGFEGGLEAGRRAFSAQLRGLANAGVEDPSVIALSEAVIERLNKAFEARAKARNQERDEAGAAQAPASVLPALASRRQALGEGAALAAPNPRARAGA